jgi:hypothetical protein
MTTQYTRRDQTFTVPQTSVVNSHREANAVNLAARHLTNRAAKFITARQVNGKLVWTVKSQTDAAKSYTVTRVADGWAADTCSCEDACYRHQYCKHSIAVNELSPVAPPAPVSGPSWDDPKLWTPNKTETMIQTARSERKARGRYEQEQEL